jgi:hypothetical protein
MLSFLVCQDFLVGTQLADSGSRWAIECIPALEEMERKKICVKTFEIVMLSFLFNIVMLSFYMPAFSSVMLLLWQSKIAAIASPKGMLHVHITR